MDKLTMADIRAQDAAAGGHFFTRSNMRFFSSQVLPYVYQGAGGVAFVTGEKFGEGSPRRFTARTWDDEKKQVRTLGPHGELSKHGARALAKAFAAGEIGADVSAKQVAEITQR